MRYLKEFKEKTKRLNESHTDDTIENVKDILLPISDMGYDISVTEDESQYAKSNQQSILIIKVRKRHSIYPLFVTYVNNPLLITDEVKEEFIRMKDYLQSEGYNSIEAHYTRFNDSPSNKDIKEFNQFINVKDPIVNLLFNAKKIL